MTTRHPLSDLPSNIRQYFNIDELDTGIRYVEPPLSQYDFPSDANKAITSPYIGLATKQPILRAGVTTVVVGDLNGYVIRNSGLGIRPIAVSMPTYLRETASLWQGEGRAYLDNQLKILHGIPNGLSSEIALYRRFKNSVTGAYEFLPMNISNSPTMDPIAQASYSKLLPLQFPTPKLPILIDETPNNILKATPQDTYALQYSRVATDVGSRLSEKLLNPLAASWLNHYLMGTAKTLVIPRSQFNDGLITEGLNNWVSKYDALPSNMREYVGLTAYDVLHDQIAAAIAKGQHSGRISGVSQDVVAAAGGAYYAAIGNAHFQTAYEGRWQKLANGRIEFNGTRTWLVADRYNWAAPDFNGKEAASSFNIPAFTSLLPPTYKKAFVDVYESLDKDIIRSRSEQITNVNDAMWAHFQMLKGGAQPFWTIGASDPEPVNINFEL